MSTSIDHLFDPPARAKRESRPLYTRPSVDDELERLTDEVLGAVRTRGFDVRRGEGVRTPDEQAVKVAEGLSRTYKSKHLSGRARDLVAFDERGNYIKEGTHPAYQAIGQEATKRGLRWGGNFKSIYDPSHIELPDTRLPDTPERPDASQFFDETPENQPDPIEHLFDTPTPRPLVTSRVVEDEEPAALTPVQFREETAPPRMGLGVETAIRAAETATGVPDLPPPRSMVRGEAKTVRVPVGPGRQTTPEAIEEALLSTLGPSAVEAGRRYRAETGRPLARLRQPFDELARSGQVRFVPSDKGDGSGQWEMSVGPSEGLARFVNAYIQGGVEGVERVNREIQGERVPVATPEPVGAAQRVASRFAAGAGQLAHNIAQLGKAAVTDVAYGKDSPEFAELIERDRREQAVIDAARKAIPEPESLPESLGDIAAKAPLYLGTGAAAPFVALAEEAHRGPMAATGAAAQFIAPMAAGRLVRGMVRSPLPEGVSRSLPARAVANVSERAAQGGINVAQYGASTPPREWSASDAAAAAAAGALMPVGGERSPVETGRFPRPSTLYQREPRPVRPPEPVASYERRVFGEKPSALRLVPRQSPAEYESRVFGREPELRKAAGEYERRVFPEDTGNQLAVPVRAPKPEPLLPRPSEVKKADPIEHLFDAPAKSPAKASDFVNLDKLNVSPAERQNLARLVEERVAETGVTKERVTFEDIKREARELDPALVAELRPPKEGETLNPAVRYAAKQRLNALNSEVLNTRLQIEEGRNRLTPEEVDKLEGRAAALEADAKQMLDVLIPTRSAAGRALAFERMMVEASGFDVEVNISRARKIAERAGENVKTERWSKTERKLRTVLAEGSEAEKRLASVEQILNERRAAPELRRAQEAAREAASAGAKPDEVRRAARRAVAEGYRERLLKMEQDARARLAARQQAGGITGGSEAGASTIPLDIADFAIIGAAKLARKGIDSAVWGREMVDEFGPEISKHLKAIYQRSYQLYQDERVSSRKAAETLRVTKGKLEDFTTEEIETLIAQAAQERAKLQEARLNLARTFARMSETHIASTIGAFGKSGLLGQVGMIARDIVGTGGQQVVASIERLPASLVDMVAGVATGRRSVTSLEPGSLARSLSQMVKTGSREAIQIARHGATREQLERLELPNEINSRSRVVNAYVNGVMRTRTVFDNYWMNQALRRSLEDRARAAALTEAKEGEIPRSRVRERTAEIVSKPPEEMAAAAVLDAEYTLYHLENLASRAVTGARNLVGPWVNLVIDQFIPFARFGGNAIRMVFYDYTPANPLVQSIRALAKAGGAARDVARSRKLSLEALDAAFRDRFTQEDQRKFSMAFGRAATGAGLMTAGYFLNRAGYMTGMRSESEGERKTEEAAGRPTLSVYNPVTKTWHSIGWLGPWGVMMGLGALWADSEGSVDRFSQIAGGVRESFGQLPLIRASKQAIDLAESAAKPELFGERAGRVLSRNVPAPVSDIALVTDTRQREARGFTAQFAQKVPGLRQRLPEKRDVFDRPLEARRTDVFDPGRTRAAKSDPVDAEFARLKVGVAETNRLPDETQEDYRARRARQGQSMDMVRRAGVASEGYQSIKDDAVRREALKDLIEYGREAASEGLPAKAVEHNSRVVVDRAKLKARVSSESSLTKEQKQRAMQRLSAVMARGMFKRKGEARTLGEVERDYRDALQRVASDYRDVLVRARGER